MNRPFQFSIATLLLTMFGVALLLGFFIALGWIACVVTFLLGMTLLSFLSDPTLDQESSVSESLAEFFWSDRDDGFRIED